MPRPDAPLRDVDPYDRGPSSTIPTYDKGCAPAGLATRRQLRAMNLCPGGHAPVAQVHTGRGDQRAHLYRLDLAQPKRPTTLAVEAALDKAMAARQTCPQCRRRYHYCLPTSLSSCLECHDGTPADPANYITPPDSHRLAA
ncbi:RRQRL motif-containing zinc-binding protein [Streptomyces scopuliridis]|uniref:RRQRL motif-containing zinc-binding protein n=1 Tax=Streptomyces scopuliridis TaxID=452529 RepID=UPI00369EEC0D